MPRNGSGTASIPNAFSSGTSIASSPMNANFTDIASELTNSLPRDGQAGMTGAFKAASGTAGAPGISFDSDTDTGFYRSSGNTIGIAAGGVAVGSIGTSGLSDANGVVVVGLPTGLGPLPWSATTAPTGWVRCNGRTMGSASSGGTERANADTENLFTHLWTNYSDTVCAVSSGRGASAAADFAANKTIGLPDMRGRGAFGLDDMGNSAASRLGTVITSATTNGSSGGTETHTLTTAQLPSHTHTGTTDSSGTHNHTYSIANVTAQTDGFGDVRLSGTSSTSTSSDGAHTHTFTTAASGSGGAHSNMPPAFLTTFIIKL